MIVLQQFVDVFEERRRMRNTTIGRKGRRSEFNESREASVTQIANSLNRNGSRLDLDPSLLVSWLLLGSNWGRFGATSSGENRRFLRIFIRKFAKSVQPLK